MDHFAKPDDELVIARETGHLHRNFQGYTTHGNCDLVAMGVSAISKIRGVFSQNFKDEASYTAALNNGELPIFKGYVTNKEDRLRAEVIQRIACYGELDMATFERRYKINFNQHFQAEIRALEPMVKDGLLKIDEDSLKVTAKGRLLVRNICMAFDEYSENSNNARFSKAI
jgi:oxygen-independent coproporphyrinogen-3 oxidase